jgi:putative nucleotidyltransferase with HDIG domain
MIESRDSYTAGHTKRVAKYSVMIAEEMGYSKREIELLENSAWLHDIGKISTPDSVLLKPGKLNDAEYTLIQDHLSAGYEMLRKIDQYQEIANIMREHHEKYDGSGYPRGLKGNEIHPLSRIMIVADAFDAMTTNRVYKPRKTLKVALDELKSLSGKHFHPEVVLSALKALKNISINEDISQLPQTTIEEQRFAYFYKDRLTNLFIIDYLSLLLRYHINSKSAYMYEIKLHNFSRYNAENSWSEGDKFLVEFASFLDNLYPKTVVFRVEGDDFMILSEKKLKDIEDKFDSCRLVQDTIVTYSIEENFIKDIATLLSR